MKLRRQAEEFKAYLEKEERSAGTVAKYTKDIELFLSWVNERRLSKELALEYKALLAESRKAASVNVTLAALNGFFRFIGKAELCVKRLRVQRQIFTDRERELTREEYNRLVRAAKQKGNERLSLILQTLCSTGIRVSELRAISAESLSEGKASVLNKGKSRIILLPADLCKKLNRYCSKRGICSGSVFVTRGGQPVNRSNVWSDMKKLCKSAGVNPQKVFPHSLRHLFARSFYSLEKDIARLADLLGHSSIETTRIYIVSCGLEHARQLDKMRLVL